MPAESGNSVQSPLSESTVLTTQPKESTRLVKKLLLEAVTVCVNYADFLEETIPYNLPQIDLWTIVTTPEDTQTQSLCSRYGLRCLKTDCFYRDVEPPRINKSRGINYALAHQSHSGWMLHLDG